MIMDIVKWHIRLTGCNSRLHFDTEEQFEQVRQLLIKDGDGFISWGVTQDEKHIPLD